MDLIIQSSATHQGDDPQPVEGSFPNVDVTPLALPEPHSFKPMYQMHQEVLRAHPVSSGPFYLAP